MPARRPLTVVAPWLLPLALACGPEALDGVGVATASAGSVSTAVVWSIREGAAGGAISAGGLYLAPAAEATYHVVATALADPRRTGEAAVAVSNSPGVDAFGVRKLYATAGAGREWTLPATADTPDAEWIPDVAGIVQRTGEVGVFHTDGHGTSAEVRFRVHSPQGKAWWRNVEMTFYSRQTSSIGACLEGWSLQARGERHAGGTVPLSQVADGVPAPAGTATWPWYAARKAGDAIDAPCLGTSVHGNLYGKAGRVEVEKEISHVDGYAPPRAALNLPGWTPTTGRWIGYKFVARNVASDPARVHFEVWVDAGASGSWVKGTEYDDAGGWLANTSTMNGCGAAPYGYAQDQIITWAGPSVMFRSDCMGIDFKWLSAREIDPLP
jgi:hypothetical protein